MIKRFMDICVAALALVVLAGPLLIIAGFVRWRLGSPVVFRQGRPGRDGAIFTMLKFRTMTDARGIDGQLLPDSERLTEFGRMLRRTSLDELPELVNVLRGEMSLVGPRPLLAQYLPLYSPTQARRHEVRPGITGWSQVNGRNRTDWSTQFEQDVWYVDHQSLRLDLRILWRTIGLVVRADGVTQTGCATREAFQGDNSSRNG